jgi:hypothetical protein
VSLAENATSSLAIVTYAHTRYCVKALCGCYKQQQQQQQQQQQLLKDCSYR